ncbi:MAG TPA: glycosyltransferase family 4 protein [Longimicrobiales bacterium]|nr:glycosyltransferase family 4 protein [Longimicrobiales bacterium]
MREPAVLHLDSSSGWGGGQNQVRLLMRELQRRSIKQLCMCPADSPLAARLQAERLPVQTISWRGGSDPRAMRHIFNALRHYNIAHCHDAHALQVAILPAKLRGARLIGARRVPFSTSAFKWNRAQRVIAVSYTVKDVLVQSGVQPARIRVVHSGTDLQETRGVQPLQPSMRAQRGVADDAFVVANAAYLVAFKGQMVIPPAAALLPDVHWFLAGAGPMKDKLEAAIAQHGVADRVHLLGWLPDARQLLLEVDAYVSASTEDGLGNSVTESLALRIPVLSADAGGGAEIVRPIQERTGAVLFEAGNAQSLAAAVRKLRDPQIRRAVLAAQDERFRDFAIERTAEQTCAVYREVLGDD